MKKVKFSEVEVGKHFFDISGGQEYIKIQTVSLTDAHIAKGEDPRVNCLFYNHRNALFGDSFKGSLHFVPSDDTEVYIKDSEP